MAGDTRSPDIARRENNLMPDAFVDEFPSLGRSHCIGAVGVFQEAASDDLIEVPRACHQYLRGPDRAYFRSISTFSRAPLWVTAIMMPMPIAIRTPIMVHPVPMLARTLAFHSAARIPMMRME